MKKRNSNRISAFDDESRVVFEEPETVKETKKESSKEIVKEPIEEPIKEPVKEPSEEPSKEPSEEPAKEPVKEPSEEPYKEPIEEPSKELDSDVIIDAFSNIGKNEVDSDEYDSEEKDSDLDGFTPIVRSLTRREKIKNSIIKHTCYNNMRKYIKTGQRVKSGDFEFLRMGSSLMLYRYTGNETCVRIPSHVGKLAVIMVYPAFLKGGEKSSVMDTLVKFVGAGDIIGDFDLFDNRTVREVEFPNTLLFVIGDIFSQCKGVRRLVVPASVKYFDNEVINGSSITEVFFNARSVPDGFDCKKFSWLSIYLRVGD